MGGVIRLRFQERTNGHEVTALRRPYTVATSIQCLDRMQKESSHEKKHGAAGR